MKEVAMQTDSEGDIDDDDDDDDSDDESRVLVSIGRPHYSGKEERQRDQEDGGHQRAHGLGGLKSGRKITSA